MYKLLTEECLHGGVRFLPHTHTKFIEQSPHTYLNFTISLSQINTAQDSNFDICILSVAKYNKI